MGESYIVYIKINDSRYVVAVNSSGFLADLTDWIKIDEGKGDQYHHAQGNYLPKPIITESGAYRYKWNNGRIEECTEEEILEQEQENQPMPVIPSNDSSVWDELDAAYQAGYDEGYTEGVNSAYDQ